MCAFYGVERHGEPQSRYGQRRRSVLSGRRFAFVAPRRAADKRWRVALNEF
jgi:hypothetical protein